MENNKDRLRHKLEVQSIQIEEFLEKHDVSMEIAGGTINSNRVDFDLGGQISAGFNRLRRLGQELAASLGSTDVRFQQKDDRLQISVKQPKSHPVDLIDLMESIEALPALTATLGLDLADRPVLLNFQTEDNVNILIAGERNAGKTGLLRSIALSLAFSNKQPTVQLAVLDLKGETSKSRHKTILNSLNYLPHMMFDVINNFLEASEALSFLVSEVNYRLKQGISNPAVFLLIDDVDQLVDKGGRPILEPLTFLLEQGEQAGLRIILGAQNPDLEPLWPLIKNTIGVKLVGRVKNSAVARAITEINDSQAENLAGEGDFIAVSNGMVVPFQAAFIDDYDLLLMVNRLHRFNQPVILAQPIPNQPTTANESNSAPTELAFDFNSQNQTVRIQTNTNTEIKRTIDQDDPPGDSLLEDTRLQDNWSTDLEWNEYSEQELEWPDDSTNEIDGEYHQFSNVGSRPIKDQKSMQSVRFEPENQSGFQDDEPIEVLSRSNLNINRNNRHSLKKTNEEIDFDWE